MATRQERIDAFTHQGVPPAEQPLELHSVDTSSPIEATVIGWRVR